MILWDTLNIGHPVIKPSTSLLIRNSDGEIPMVFENESIALFDRMTTEPDETRKNLINTSIKGLKDYGIFEKSDCFWLMASHDRQASKLNIIKDAHNLIEINSPTFTIDAGFTGDGSSTCLAPDFNPQLDAIHYKEYDASLGAYSMLDIDGHTEICINSGYSTLESYTCCGAAGVKYWRVNSNTGFVQFSSAEKIGLAISVKSDPTKNKGYTNGIKLAEDDVAFSGIGDTCRILKRGASPDYSSQQVSAGFICASLNQTEITAITNIIQAYLNGL